MTIINNKNSYRILLIITFITINILILIGISNILGYLNSGANRENMLHENKTISSTYLPKVFWKEPKDKTINVEKPTLQTIENHYLFSWVLRNNALKENTYTGIGDYFTKNSKANLVRTVKYNKLKKITIESTTIEHHPQLNFMSADGQQVVFTDDNVVEFQNIYQDKQLISSIQDTTSYKVMMVLEDGYWRVRHCVKIANNTIHESIKNEKLKKTFEVEENKILKNGKPFIIKGINYYPKNAAWDMYGPEFNKDTIAADFDIISKAKLNTIRIFIPFDDFGKEYVNEDKIQKLITVIDLAKSKNLDVIVTLFDFYGDYSVNNWTITHRHAEKIVLACKDLDNILAWDIKNEPDLDFETRGSHNVKAWLENMIGLVKKFDPTHLVTIGYSNIKSGEILKEKVDFISYHFYEDISLFETKLAQLKQTTTKPLVVQEFGMSSNIGFWSWFGNTRNNQALYHQQMQTIFKTNQISFVSWTLYDFPEVPNKVAGKYPWIKSKQKQFGFIDINGKPKPSFKYINY